jgi:hypothetical protein
MEPRSDYEAPLIFIKKFDNIYIVKGGKGMEAHERYQKMVDRANFLNQDAPWIYSDTWLSMFLDELGQAFALNDENLIRELEEAIK